ncbi:hypothetical protein Tco_1243056 [Tanacetum coccineum]
MDLTEGSIPNWPQTGLNHLNLCADARISHSSSIAVLDASTPWFADIANYHAGNFVIKGMSTSAEEENSSRTIARIVKNSRACIFIKSFTSSASFWESRETGYSDLKSNKKQQAKSKKSKSTECKGTSQKSKPM